MTGLKCVIAAGALVSGGGGVLPATAQTTADSGTVFIFSQGRVERFVRQDGDVQIWSTLRGREYERAVNPVIPTLKWSRRGRSGERTISGNPDRIWPPEPGLSTRFRVLTKLTEADGRKRRIVQPWTCKVHAVETINVADSRLETLPIVCDRYSIHSMRPLQKRTWWWAPELGHYVQRRTVDFRDGEVSEVRLCAALPPHRAQTPRIEALVDAGC